MCSQHPTSDADDNIPSLSRRRSLPVKVARRVIAAVALGMVALPQGHHEAVPAAAKSAVASAGSPSVAATSSQEAAATTTQPQGGASIAVVISAVAGGATALLTLAGIWVVGQRRKADQGNDDLQQTIAMLRELGVEARRVADLNGTSGMEDLADLVRLVPHVEHAAAQYTGSLHSQLTRVGSLMTDTIATLVKIGVIEDAYINAGTPADVPEQLRLTSFAAQICCQTRTADRLVAAIADATAAALRLRA